MENNFERKVLYGTDFYEGLRAKRDYAMLATLLGCGLRRSELIELELDEIRTRQEHWAIVDLVGKGGHIRARDWSSAMFFALRVKLSAKQSPWQEPSSQAWGRSHRINLVTNLITSG